MITLKATPITDKSLTSFDDYKSFQDFNIWQTAPLLDLGTIGSNLVDFRLTSNQTPLAAAVINERSSKLMSSVVAWVRGGPLFIKSKNAVENEKNLKKFLVNLVSHYEASYKRVYINIVLNNASDIRQKLMLKECGWKRPLLERGTNWTIILPIDSDSEKNFSLFQSKWRNQLRKAQKNGIEFDVALDSSLMSRYQHIHNDMCHMKSKQNLALSGESIQKLSPGAFDTLITIIGKHNGRDVCGCVVPVVQNKAFYLYAAANSEGRSGYYSNAMLWELVQQLSHRQIKELDLCGIDPSLNWGGYHFKQGTGGQAVEYLGEWEYSNSKPLRAAVNLLQSYRFKKLYG